MCDSQGQATRETHPLSPMFVPHKIFKLSDNGYCLIVTERVQLYALSNYRVLNYQQFTEPDYKHTSSTQLA